VLLKALTARSVGPSTSSQRATARPTPTIATAAVQALSTSGNTARAACTSSAIPWSFNVSSVMTPRVPSEPTKRLVRS
jgi:hypothetical protein